MFSLLIISSLFIAANALTLDEYVWRPDSNYAWYDTGLVLNGTNIFQNETWTGYVLNMTSQRWLTDKDFAENSDTKSIWWHYLVGNIFYYS